MISYICSRTKPQCRMYCENNPNYECNHTSDRDFSVNWADHEPSDEELKEFFVRYGQHIADPDWFERSDVQRVR